MRTFESGGSLARPELIQTDTERSLNQLSIKIEIALDRIHDEALAKFRALARSVGQRTRVRRSW